MNETEAVRLVLRELRRLNEGIEVVVMLTAVAILIALAAVVWPRKGDS